MKLRPIMAVFVLALLFSSAVASDVPASAGSIRELLVITGSRAKTERLFARFDDIAKATMQQAMNGETPSPAQKKVMDRAVQRVRAALQEEVGWGKIEPLLVEAYQKVLTEEEVAGMVTFYKSKAGIAALEKLPVAMEGVQEVLQVKIRSASKKFEELTSVSLSEVKAELAKAEAEAEK